MKGEREPRSSLSVTMMLLFADDFREVRTIVV